jgi:hypothetical protein
MTLSFSRKFQDPEFHQSLTNSLVFHHDTGVGGGSNSGISSFEREGDNLPPTRAPYPFPPPPVSRLQGRNSPNIALKKSYKIN